MRCLFVLFSLLVTATYGITCYYGNYRPSESLAGRQYRQCPNTQYCIKIFNEQTVPYVGASYDCDSARICFSSNCVANFGSDTTCCCGHDWCNSGSNFAILGSVMLPFLTYILC